MKSNILFDRRSAYIAVVLMLLLTSIVSAFASAAQLTVRSIELSNSSVASTNVTYGVAFTAVGAAEATVIDFCSNSPIIGQPCTAPAGFVATNAASATAGFTNVSDLDANTIVVEGTIAPTANVAFDVTGITNPTNSGPLYARIVSYDTTVNANLYESEDVGDGVEDTGGVAMSITQTIGVSGAVLESLIFCVSAAQPQASCAGSTTPILALGETVGDGVALVPTAVSEGKLHTQISTNASSGAVVRLKSSATNCGGLMRAGAPTACDILPALDDGITANQARFGVKTAVATDTPDSNANGVFQPVPLSVYNDLAFALNYQAGNATGVTSTFGDPFLDTNGAPANNKNVELTFGASVTNSTPAGLYSTDLSLIATGKF